MRLWTLLVCCALVACASCGADPSGPEDPGGGHQTPITLSAWSGEARDRPSGAELTYFAAAVKRLSDGHLVIAPVYGPGTGETEGEDVITAVTKHHVDIGLEASRTFSTRGVLTFRALTVPFLIQTNELAGAVSGDPAVTQPMLAGLSAKGMTGLGLVPETIRHPFGVQYKPVLGPEDYQGRTLRTLPSDETFEVFRWLGAKPEFVDATDFMKAMDDKKIDIVESSFELAHSVMGRSAIATGNVAFFPRMNVLFANSEAMTSLSPEDRTVLQQAAEDARQHALSAITSEATAARAYCLEGGQIVNASAAQQQALHAKVAGYITHLESDAATKTVIEAIKDVAARTPGPSEAPQPCGMTPRPPLRTSPWPVSPGPSPIDGTYRVQISTDELRKVGVPPAEMDTTQGTLTMTIGHGSLTVDQVSDPPVAEPHTVWSIAFKQPNQVMLFDPTADPDYSGVIWTGTWSLDGAGNLSLHDYTMGHNGMMSDYVWWFSQPLERVS